MRISPRQEVRVNLRPKERGAYVTAKQMQLTKLHHRTHYVKKCQWAAHQITVQSCQERNAHTCAANAHAHVPVHSRALAGNWRATTHGCICACQCASLCMSTQAQSREYCQAAYLNEALM